MNTSMDVLGTALLDLSAELQELPVPMLIGGGFGLYLKQLHLQEGKCQKVGGGIQTSHGYVSGALSQIPSVPVATARIPLYPRKSAVAPCFLALPKSIPGIGAITAVAVLAEMPEIGSLDPKAAASLAGLAPVTRQSGNWQGRSFVQGGRRRLRKALYMPAVSAISCNPDLARKYRQLCMAGKPSKVAITAVMRKLLLLANALIAKDRTWAAAVPTRT